MTLTPLKGFLVLLLVVCVVVGVFFARGTPSTTRISSGPLSPVASTLGSDPAAGAELLARLKTLSEDPEYSRCTPRPRNSPSVPTDCSSWVASRIAEYDAWFEGRRALSFASTYPTGSTEQSRDRRVFSQTLQGLARAAGELAHRADPRQAAELATAGLRWGTVLMQADGPAAVFLTGGRLVARSLEDASRVALAVDDAETRGALVEQLRAHPIGADAARVLTRAHLDTETLLALPATLGFSRDRTLAAMRVLTRQDLAQLDLHPADRTPAQYDGGSVFDQVVNPIGRKLVRTGGAEYLSVVVYEDIARGLHAGLFASLTGDIGEDGLGRPLQVQDELLVGSIDGLEVYGSVVAARWPAPGSASPNAPVAGVYRSSR
jgi:hypothetical protein